MAVCGCDLIKSCLLSRSSRKNFPSPKSQGWGHRTQVDGVERGVNKRQERPPMSTGALQQDQGGDLSKVSQRGVCPTLCAHVPSAPEPQQAPGWASQCTLLTWLLTVDCQGPQVPFYRFLSNSGSRSHPSTPATSLIFFIYCPQPTCQSPKHSHPTPR